MIRVQRRAYEKLITELIYARDIRRLVKKYNVDRAYYFSVLKDISNGKRSPNYDILTKVAHKRDLSEDFVVEQARSVLNFYVPYDHGQSPDYYKLLKVTSDAPDEEIRRNWIELMKANHPDKVGPEGLDRSKKINEAYEVLKDTEKRDRYDRMNLPFIPVLVERRDPYQNLYYAAPFIVIALFAFLYVSGSGLLFRSQEEKEQLAKVLENPELPNAIYSGDKLAMNEAVPGGNEEDPDELDAAEPERVKPADEIVSQYPAVSENAEAEKVAEAGPEKTERRQETPEETPAEKEPMEVASVSEPDKGEQTSAGDVKSRSIVKEPSAETRHDVVKDEGEETSKAREVAALEPEKEEKMSAEEAASAPEEEKAQTPATEELSEPEEPVEEKVAALNADETESNAAEQKKEEKPEAKETSLASIVDKEEKEAPAEKPKPPVLKTTAYGEAYTVKNGDSLWTIARKFNTRTAEILRLNGMTTSTIQPGDEIIVSGKGVPAPPAVTETVKTTEAEKKEIVSAKADTGDTTKKNKPEKFDPGISATAVAGEKTELVTSKPAPAAPAPDKDSLYGFVSDYVSAYKSRDVGRVESLFAPDAVENGKSISTVLSSYSSSFASQEIISYDIRVRNASVYKDTGTVGGDFSISFRDQRTGARKSSKGRINWKLYWDSGEWKIKELSYKVEKTDS